MKTRRETVPIAQKWIRPMLWGLISGMAVCLLLLLLMAAIMAASDVPQAAVTPMAVVAAAAGAFVGGFTAARIARENGWLLGALVGLLLYVLIALAGLIFLQDTGNGYVLVKLAILVACGAVGGIVGVNMRKRH